MSAKSKVDRAKRLEIANQFIRIIAGYGRHYFLHQDRYAHFEFDSLNRIVYVDKHSQKRIYIHLLSDSPFLSEGGTLEFLIRILAKYINGKRDLPLDFLGPDDLLAYKDDMTIVREECAKLKEAAA